MFGIYGGLVPGARNAWSYWIDYIMKQQDRLGVVSAVMLTTRGDISAFTKDFIPSPAEIQKLNELFDSNPVQLQTTSDKLSFVERTYIIRIRPSDDPTESVQPRLLVAFSGSRYLLVCRTLTKYVAIETEGRRGHQWLTETVTWLSRLGQKLIDKNF